MLTNSKSSTTLTFRDLVLKGITEKSHYEKLIKRGENINQTNYMGQTALFAAVSANRFDLFKMLINLGADRKITDIKGIDVFSWAKEHERDDDPDTFRFAKWIQRLDADEAAAEMASKRKNKK